MVACRGCRNLVVVAQAQIHIFVNVRSYGYIVVGIYIYTYIHIFTLCRCAEFAWRTNSAHTEILSQGEGAEICNERCYHEYGLAHFLLLGTRNKMQ